MNVLFKTMTIVVFVFTLVSCDDDFNSVGSEIIGDVNFRDDQYAATPIAYSKSFDRVQTSNLPVYGLGAYKDLAYGLTTYSILSQVQPGPTGFDPEFGDEAILDSVVLSLPYFSTAIEVNSVQIGEKTEIATTYRLDSIYGNRPFKLSIYQSNYFLRDVDPSTNERQVYYSNDVANSFATNALEGTLLFTRNSFIPSGLEMVLTTPDGSDSDSLPERERVSPRLRVKFDDEIVNLFKTQFLDKEGSSELSNSNNFLNYFRGIYIKAEAVSGNGNLVCFNLANANLTLHYSFKSSTSEDREQGELALAFSNNIINGITTEPQPASNIPTELLAENQDSINGEANLYLKGGDGSFAVIDLFNKDITNENGEQENELQFLRRQNWLINDATLKFYINKDNITSGDVEPERIYIFNLETGEVLADYGLDASFGLLNQQDPVNSILNHLGRISRDSDDNGESYTIGLTQHIIDLLKGDTDNIKLGVSVSQNVNITTNSIGDTPVGEDEIIPTSSVFSHEGTILYGNTENVPEAKRLKLDIFYTESKDN